MKYLASAGFRFNSGRELWVSENTIGICVGGPMRGAISTGYADNLTLDAAEWTNAERRELADYMIAAWSAWQR